MHGKQSAWVRILYFRQASNERQIGWHKLVLLFSDYKARQKLPDGGVRLPAEACMVQAMRRIGGILRLRLSGLHNVLACFE